MHSDLAVLAARIEHLERRERRWRRGAGALLALGAVLVFTGQGGGRIVECDKLVLKDPDGRPRMVLWVDRTGGKDTWATHATWYDPKGDARLDLASWDHGASAINLWAPEGGRGAILCTPKDRSACFSLSNGGQTRIRLQADPDGGPAQVDINDRQGALRARLGVAGEKDMPDAVLYDAGGEPRVSLTRGKREGHEAPR